MTIVLKSQGFSVPAARALNMRGVQTDAYGEVRGGHRGLYDFKLPSTPDAVPSGGSLQSVLLNGASAPINWPASGITAAKGLPFPGGATRILTVGDAYNPAEMGSTPSFLISAWITFASLAIYQGVAGCADGNTAAQIGWRWLTVGTGGANLNMALNSGGSALAEVNASGLFTGTPMLITMVARKSSATGYTLTGYFGSTFKGSAAGLYPIFNPTALPVIGDAPGRSSVPVMTLHRTHCIQFDPDNFSVDTWLAAEIAANGSRFA